MAFINIIVQGGCYSCVCVGGGGQHTVLFFFLKDEIQLLDNVQNIALFVRSKASFFFFFK